tara:strand:+ start:509 stop:856 length:348 start_codon:yes stop_codon:yes gene_type:complete
MHLRPHEIFAFGRSIQETEMSANLSQNPTETSRIYWQERAFVPLLTAADILGLSRASVYALEAEDRLTFARLAGRTLVCVESLKALINAAEPWVASDRGKEARAARVAACASDEA